MVTWCAKIYQAVYWYCIMYSSVRVSFFNWKSKKELHFKVKSVIFKKIHRTIKQEFRIIINDNINHLLSKSPVLDIASSVWITLLI